MKIIDLSQPLYPGIPRVRIQDPLELRTDHIVLPPAAADLNLEIRVTHIGMCAHAGTHIDAASHFIPDGKTIDRYQVDRFVGSAVILDVRKQDSSPIEIRDLINTTPSIEKGDIVFLYTGFADRYGNDSYYDHPYLTEDAAEFLVECEINILGIDTLTPEVPFLQRSSSYQYPVHRRLLQDDILIVENLGSGLKKVLGHRVTVSLPPLRISGADASPVAPVAIVVGSTEPSEQ